MVALGWKVVFPKHQASQGGGQGGTGANGCREEFRCSYRVGSGQVRESVPQIVLFLGDCCVLITVRGWSRARMGPKDRLSASGYGRGRPTEVGDGVQLESEKVQREKSLQEMVNWKSGIV